MKIAFTIPGNPVGKPRMTRQDKWIKRPRVMRYRAWCDMAKIAFKSAWKVSNSFMGENDALIINITAYLPIPKSLKKQIIGGQAHIKRPDRDNILKSVQDALNGVAYKDDRQVYDGRTTKLYSNNPRTEVEIEYLFV